MKKSEELKLEGNQEDNDLKAMGLYNKSLREKRHENFEDKWLDRISSCELIEYIKYHETMLRYTINIKNFGLVDYFPKKNNLLIRKDNKWKKPGLQWLVKKLNL